MGPWDYSSLSFYVLRNPPIKYGAASVSSSMTATNGTRVFTVDEVRTGFGSYETGLHGSYLFVQVSA